MFLLQLLSRRSCSRSPKKNRSCLLWGALTPLSITPLKLSLAVRYKTRPSSTRSLEAPSRTRTMSYQHRTKLRSLQVPVLLTVKEEREVQEETAGILASASSSPGPFSRVSPPLTTTFIVAPPPMMTRWKSLACSLRARAARPQPQCHTSRSLTWLYPGLHHCSWGRRLWKQCARPHWRGCLSRRKAWRMERKKDSWLLHHWRCWIALFSRGAMLMIKFLKGKRSDFMFYELLFSWFYDGFEQEFSFQSYNPWKMCCLSFIINLSLFARCVGNLTNVLPFWFLIKNPSKCAF